MHILSFGAVIIAISCLENPSYLSTLEPNGMLCMKFYLLKHIDWD